MEGRFFKIDVSNLKISSQGGIDCNNENPQNILQIMQHHFGKPNGNNILQKLSTWQYVLKYQNIYITIYDYDQFWSIGFLEIQSLIPDYKLINSIIQMTKSFLIQELNDSPASNHLSHMPPHDLEKVISSKPPHAPH